jgi:hypothetical protein
MRLGPIAPTGSSYQVSELFRALQQGFKGLPDAPKWACDPSLVTAATSVALQAVSIKKHTHFACVCKCVFAFQSLGFQGKASQGLEEA